MVIIDIRTLTVQFFELNVTIYVMEELEEKLFTAATAPNPHLRLVESLAKLYLIHSSSFPNDTLRYYVWKCLLGASFPVSSSSSSVDTTGVSTSLPLLPPPPPGTTTIPTNLTLLHSSTPTNISMEQYNERIRTVTQDLPNQRVIGVDAERTRPDITHFRTPETLNRIKYLLTYYCKEGYTGTVPFMNNNVSSTTTNENTVVSVQERTTTVSSSSLISFSKSSTPSSSSTSSTSTVSPTGNNSNKYNTNLGSSNSSSGVSYRQGLNELLAPFLILQCQNNVTKEPLLLADSEIMLMFSRLVARFTPRIFANTADTDFISLQCSLRLLSLLLQYHDPKLAMYLEQYTCVPELYATPWFLTLFARSLAKEELFTLWDFLIVTCRRPGPVILHALAIAFLVSNRDTIMKSSTKGSTNFDLPVVMSKLVFENCQHVSKVCGHALEILASTPLTFRRLITNVCYSGGPGLHDRTETIPVSPALLARLEKRICIKIGVEEVLLGAGSRFATTPTVQGALARAREAMARSGGGAAALVATIGEDPLTSGKALLRRDEVYELPPRYFLIDIRSKEEYEYGGHLPTAFHIAPETLQDPEKLDEIMKIFQGLKDNVHFVILGAGDINQWYQAPVPPTAILSDFSASITMNTNNTNNVSNSSSNSTKGKGTSTAPSLPQETTKSVTTSTTLIDDLKSSNIVRSASSLLSSSVRLLRQGDDEMEYAALETGLEPLSANEEDDYGKNDATRTLVALFLQKGFSRVSEVEGGYTALHQNQALFVDEVLVGHDRTYCMVCSGGNAKQLYPGRNAVERGELIQDATPYRTMNSSSNVNHNKSRSSLSISTNYGSNTNLQGSVKSPIDNSNSTGSTPRPTVNSVGRPSAPSGSSIETKKDTLSTSTATSTLHIPGTQVVTNATSAAIRTGIDTVSTVSSWVTTVPPSASVSSSNEGDTIPSLQSVSNGVSTVIRSILSPPPVSSTSSHATTNASALSGRVSPYSAEQSPSNAPSSSSTSSSASSFSMFKNLLSPPSRK